MPCTCHSICPADFSVNLCSGNVAACVNDFSFTSVIINAIILASHLAELESAIDAERVNAARRFNTSDPASFDCSAHTPGDVACSTNDFSAFGFSGDRSADDSIDVDHWDNIKDANNEVVTDSTYGVEVTTNFLAQSVDPVNSVILASDVTDLQTKINQTRNVCICDSHCNCDGVNCGCDGECPADDYYVPYS